MLDRLPTELLALVLRRLPLRQLLGCSTTCHAAHSASQQHDDIWRDVFLRETTASSGRMPSPSELPAGGYKAAFRAYIRSSSPIVLQLEPSRTLCGFAKEGPVVLAGCGRRRGRLVPDEFEAATAGMLGALGLPSLRGTSVAVVTAPLDDASCIQALIARLFELGAAQVRLVDSAVATLAASERKEGTVLFVEYDGVGVACVADGRRLPLPPGLPRSVRPAHAPRPDPLCSRCTTAMRRTPPQPRAPPPSQPTPMPPTSSQAVGLAHALGSLEAAEAPGAAEAELCWLLRHHCYVRAVSCRRVSVGADERELSVLDAELPQTLGTPRGGGGGGPGGGGPLLRSGRPAASLPPLGSPSSVSASASASPSSPSTVTSATSPPPAGGPPSPLSPSPPTTAPPPPRRRSPPDASGGGCANGDGEDNDASPRRGPLRRVRLSEQRFSALEAMFDPSHVLACSCAACPSVSSSAGHAAGSACTTDEHGSVAAAAAETAGATSAASSCTSAVAAAVAAAEAEAAPRGVMAAIRLAIEHCDRGRWAALYGCICLAGMGSCISGLEQRLRGELRLLREVEGMPRAVRPRLAPPPSLTADEAAPSSAAQMQKAPQAQPSLPPLLRLQLPASEAHKPWPLTPAEGAAWLGAAQISVGRGSQPDPAWLPAARFQRGRATATVQAMRAGGCAMEAWLLDPAKAKDKLLRERAERVVMK